MLAWPRKREKEREIDSSRSRSVFHVLGESKRVCVRAYARCSPGVPTRCLSDCSLGHLDGAIFNPESRGARPLRSCLIIAPLESQSRSGGAQPTSGRFPPVILFAVSQSRYRAPSFLPRSFPRSSSERSARTLINRTVGALGRPFAPAFRG